MDEEKLITKIKIAHGITSERGFADFLGCSPQNINRQKRKGKLINTIINGLVKRGLDITDYLDPPPPEADNMPNIVDELNRIGINIASKMGESIGEIKSEMKRCNDRLDLIESHLGIKKTSSNGNSY